jgi:hypothetical protein
MRRHGHHHVADSCSTFGEESGLLQKVMFMIYNEAFIFITTKKFASIDSKMSGFALRDMTE